MSERALYIAAYDVVDNKRRRRMRKMMQGYATGGQKSVFECFLNSNERRWLIIKGCSHLDEQEDRFAILRVEERTQPILHGIATPPVDPHFRYVG